MFLMKFFNKKGTEKKLGRGYKPNINSNRMQMHFYSKTTGSSEVTLVAAASGEMNNKFTPYIITSEKNALQEVIEGGHMKTQAPCHHFGTDRSSASNAAVYLWGHRQT